MSRDSKNVMPLYARIIAGCLGLLTAWTMVRAWRSGKVGSRDLPYAQAEPRIAFMLVMAARVLTLLACLWFASGYTRSIF
jgi:hypothetical protein